MNDAEKTKKDTKREFEKYKRRMLKELTNEGFDIRTTGHSIDDIQTGLTVHYECLKESLKYKSADDVKKRVVAESYLVSLQLKGKPETKVNAQSENYKDALTQAKDKFPVMTDKGIIETIELTQTLKFPKKDLETLVKKEAPKPAGRYTDYTKTEAYNF